MRSLVAPVLAILLLASMAIAPVPQAPQPDGTELGDVQYSLLIHSEFVKVHGHGWVLMDGRAIQGSALCERTGLCTLPDARGVFVRGMNVGRKGDTGDPDGDRGVGVYQADALGRHAHELARFPNGAGFDNHGNGHPQRLQFEDGQPWNNVVVPLTTTEVGGPETRPRNIALYVYAKIN